MKLLMHTCCAPCSVYCIDELRKEGIEPTLYWYNPNIHPYMEYKLRKECLEEYSKKVNVNAIFEEEYGLDIFCKEAVKNINARCINYCYPVRLRKTFEYAKANGYDTVTTTLLYSIYQKHDFIKKLMEDLSKEYRIDFLYRDFRVGYWEGHEKAIEAGLYMQKYCGCVFSEEERYLNRNNVKPKLPEGFEFKKRRPLEVKKINDINLINNELIDSLLDLYTKEEIDSYINNSNIYGLSKDEEIISLVIIKEIDRKNIELKYIITENKYRNKGYSKRLLKSLCGNYKQKYDKIIVNVKAKNLGFFIKQGFDNYEKEENNMICYSKKLKAN